MMRALLLALALSVCATSAYAEDPGRTFAPLIGCWRGAFEGNAEMRDTRCFERVFNGRYVRDTHNVRPGSYGGQTMYFFDVQAQTLAFTYYASDGAMSTGHARVERGAFVFDEHAYVGADGQTMRMRARWTLDGADRFVATTEVERDGAWQPWARITYRRQPR
ncbi:MAG: hypothetical protein NT015_11495 [Alphaproteobacteria bacterium]|nr:hypothetical protein [Alphaproteobacteria bacterium]